MIIILLISLILVAVLPWNKNTVFNVAIMRLSGIAIIFSSFLIMNILIFERLSSGVSVHSGFISISSINQSLLILLLLTGGTILAVLSSNRYFSFNQKNNTQLILSPVHTYFNNYSLVILFNLIGASLLATVSDVLSLYIAIETQSFSLYLLSSLQNDSVNSAKAGLKYFLIGSLASTIILLGISLIYYTTGLTNFESLFTYLNITDFYSAGAYSGGIVESSPFFQEMHFWNFAEFNPYYSLIFLGFILILSGLFIKIGAAPFHQWAPDVYSLVPTAVTTWLVIVPKISIFILIYQILELILNTGNANNYGNIATEVYNFFENENIILTYQNNSNFLSYIENITILNLFYKLLEVYNEATFFYPHYLQLELTNLYNSPIINETDFNKYEDTIKSVWDNFETGYHNVLLYNINIPQIGSLTIKNYLSIIAIISLIIGALGGLMQIKIKRLLAFSSINNVGFIIIALAINNKIGLESFLFYLIQYTLTNLNIFFILISFGYLIYSNPINIFTLKNNNNNNNSFNNLLIPDLNYISQLRGFFINNPILTLSLIISLFSLAGIPPLVGFYAKQQVLVATLSLGFIFISIIAINTSVISASYYLQLIKNSLLQEINIINLKNKMFKTNNSPLDLNVIIQKQKLNLAESPNLNTEIKNNKNNSPTEVILFESLINYNSNLQTQQINNNFTIKLASTHSYLISLITLSILFFIFKANLFFNFTSIITSYLFIL